MSKTIYVVYGSTGEYEDKREWYLGYYISEEKAKSKVKELNAMCDEYGVSFKKMDEFDSNIVDKISEKIRKTVDKHCYIDYTGVGYDYWPLTEIED